MNKSILLKTYVTSALLCLTLFASCSADDDNTALPEGKYPMTFATAMEGLTQTRATTDNTWTGGEKIAVQVGNEVKQYKPESDQTGKLTGVDAANTFYWQKTDETKTVSAWYCGTGSETTLPTTWTVKTDQSGDGYAKSDLLYAKPQDIAYSDSDKKLTFNHLPAKVVINLAKGNGLTDENIRNATVRIFCQAITSGKIEKSTGIMEQTTTTDRKEITPNNVSGTPPEGFQKSVQAIVVPQQVAGGTKFIKVTIGTGDAARDYYYTTESAGNANFECGKQYTYNITVTKGEELEVTDLTTVSWKDGTAQSAPVAEATSFNVTCPGNGVEGFKISGVTPSGDKYTVNPNQTITISYAATSNLRCYLVQGIAQISTATSGTDITHTVSGIRGDLVFSFEECPKVGDYYYADGTWSSDYPSGSTSAACIGIVFKVGAGTGDDASYYGSKLPNGIRGYVVALEDACKSTCAWGGDNVLIGTSTNQDDYLGYSNSLKIVAKANEGGHLKPNDDKYDYPAMYYISTYGNSFQTPANSSGWYLPSTGQLSDIYQERGNIQEKVTTAKGTWFNLDKSGETDETNISDYYLSSSEYDFYNATPYHASSFSFGTGKKYWREKDSDPAYVRAILTF